MCGVGYSYSCAAWFRISLPILTTETPNSINKRININIPFRIRRFGICLAETIQDHFLDSWEYGAGGSSEAGLANLQDLIDSEIAHIDDLADWTASNPGHKFNRIS